MIMHKRELERTKAATNTMPIEAMKTIVATIRTGLNMSLSCWKKPMRKPVPIREIIMPMVYMKAKDRINPRKSNEVPINDRTKPMARHIPKPYNLCCRLSFKNAKAESPSNICV